MNNMSLNVTVPRLSFEHIETYALLLLILNTMFENGEDLNNDEGNDESNCTCTDQRVVFIGRANTIFFRNSR